MLVEKFSLKQLKIFYSKKFILLLVLAIVETQQYYKGLPNSLQFSCQLLLLWNGNGYTLKVLRQC